MTRGQPGSRRALWVAALSIFAVSALAGYCSTADGHRVAFAFMMSGMNVGAARRIQDRMTVALARVSLG